MIYLASWYIQDFLWVLGAGKVLVPEIFLLSAVFLSLFQDEPAEKTVWCAFLGGLLWDLRWLGFPGVTSLVYVLTLMVIRWIWDFLPLPGKTVHMFALLLWSSNVPVSLVRIFLWGLRGSAILGEYLLQQSYILPLVLLASAGYAWRLKKRDA